MDAVDHPDMIAFITGNAQPIYGRVAHAAAMKQMITVVTRVTGTFTGEMVLPNGKVIPPTGKAFDVEFGHTTKWDGICLSRVPPSGTPLCRRSRSGSPSPERRVSNRAL